MDPGDMNSNVGSDGKQVDDRTELEQELDAEVSETSEDDGDEDNQDERITPFGQ